MSTIESRPFEVAPRETVANRAASFTRKLDLKLAGRVARAMLAGGVAAFVGSWPASAADPPPTPFTAALKAPPTKTPAATTPGNSNPFRPAASASQAGYPAVRPRDGGASPGGSTRAQSDQAMLDARRALSVGDLPRAQQYLGQVEQLRVAYEGDGDSPPRVADSIEKFQQIVTLRKSDPNGAAWRQQYAKFLIEQAQALMAWNDFETAARAANEALQLNPAARVGAMTPQALIRQIEAHRMSQLAMPVAPAPASLSTSAAQAKSETSRLLELARAALRDGNLSQAEILAGEASALNVPDSQFGPQEDSPARLAMDVARARLESGNVQLAGGVARTATPEADDYFSLQPSSPEIGPRLAAAPIQAGETVLPATPLPAPTRLPQAAESPQLNVAGGAGDAFQLLENGEKALKAGDRAAALESFQAAYKLRDELDLINQQRLQGHLQMLSPVVGGRRAAADGDLLRSAATGQTVVARQLSADISKRQSEAAKLREDEPNKAVALLVEARKSVEQAELSEELRSQLLRRVDMSLSDVQRYIKDHKAELELDAANKAILDEIARERVVKVEVQQRTAELVDKFNKLIDEQRFPEAELVAKQLYDMSPDELVAQQVWKQAKMIRRERWSRDIAAESENGVANVLLDARASTADAVAKMNTPFSFDSKTWDAVKGRKTLTELGSPRQLKEIEIEQKLRTQVLPRYDETPLTKVVEGLSQLAGVNIHLDPRGLTQEGVRSDTPITLNLPQEISLKSALTLILEPLHLTYTIKDEVLKITSEQIRDGEVYIKTYPVGDLVIPIPNFVPNSNFGLQGLINDAYSAMGYGNGPGVSGPIAVVAGARRGQQGVAAPKEAMAQQFGAGNIGGGGASVPFGGGGAGGPGGLGGAAQADFDSLIDLITSTVEHDSWMENGTGEGEIQPFATNLSLVISQTQRVHEQIADLLAQLRRLQDLQVTIEVRFIRLQDDFFERIGIDFDFNIEDGTNIPTAPGNPNSLVNGVGFEPNRRSSTVGLQFSATGIPTGAGFPNYAVDLDVPFRQESFGLSTPQFGSPAEVGNFGFAILSDIEAYFLVSASQGDRRSNVLQAPKVTLYNGQQAVVTDASFRPFVISVIPVVGEFAAAQQPVIVVLSEGTMMTVQAVVSDDRRYVRLTLVPFFSSIGEVREFTFEGSSTTQSSSNNTDADEDGSDENSQAANTVSRSGTTVQLPTFQVVSVSTTVSVPDGGTVLLGGIKRLSEGRNEFGVPLLSKVPYIDRLFRNVGIGRSTDSLMMMVTPHIIIQEEEEERLGIAAEE